MIKYFLLLLLVTFTGISCSDTLSESQAKEAIIIRHEFPKNVQKEFKLKDESFNVRNTERDFKKLKSEGLLTYNTYRAFMGNGISASLTNKANKYLISSSKNNVTVIVAKYKFDKIISIVDVTDNLKEVKFSYTQTDITPFGRILFNYEEKTIQYNQQFVKSNKGWVIKN